MKVFVSASKEAAENSLLMAMDLPRKRTCIERVSVLLRRNASNKEDYDPKMVSIGPYHHGKAELEEAEKIKPIIAHLFAYESGRTMDEFYYSVLSKVDYFRSCYVQGSTDKFNNEKFGIMMLMDGCLVLALIEYFASSGQKGLRYMDEITDRLGLHAPHCLILDAFRLLENQLPFQVLDLLLGLRFEGDQGMKMMAIFLDQSVSWDLNPARKLKVDAACIQAMKPLHFLELSHRITTEQSHPPNSHRKNTGKYWAKHKVQEVVHFFRSVSELKAKGIYVSPSTSYSPAAIKFTSFGFYGLLHLPPVMISPSQRVTFLNTIAYELSPSNSSDKCLTTAYINFMKSLVIHPDDVKELRLKHILLSDQYSSDEEVVNIIQSITTYPVESDFVHNKVRRKIQEHYNSKAKTWIAELIHNYFSSPWTLIAVLVATCLVPLSFLQTYFTIFPRSGKHN